MSRRAGILLGLCCTALLAAPASVPAQPLLSWSSATPIDPANPLPGATVLAPVCPTYDECVLSDSVTTFTFTPLTPYAPVAARTLGAERNWRPACPSRTECVATDTSGDLVRFDPTSTAAATVISTGSPIGTGPRVLAACPTVDQCSFALTAPSGIVVTLDPQSPGTESTRPALAELADNGGVADDLTCPTTTLCVAVNSIGMEAAFDPEDPGGSTVTSQLISPPGSLQRVVCPSSTQCTALDERGDTITFDPLDPSVTPLVVGVDPEVQLTGISCAQPDWCVGVDAQGRALEGDPQRAQPWTIEPINQADVLIGVSCPSPGVCVAADPAGRVFLSAPAAALAPAVAPAGAISGPAVVGGTLIPTGWTAAGSNDVIAQLWIWLRCDRAGGRCLPIYGADGPRYTPGYADVGSTIRVQESLAGTGATGAPVRSAATAPVQRATAARLVAARATRRGRLTVTLGCPSVTGQSCRTEVVASLGASVLARWTVTVAAASRRLFVWQLGGASRGALARHHRIQLTLVPAGGAAATHRTITLTR
jgi:hypothetical protein